jgi:hypothetical protein
MTNPFIRHEEKIYGVMAEWKDEGPLVMESYLLTYDKAYERMQSLLKEQRIIRVAMFEAVYAYGNKTLIPEKQS